ncbi:MAG TPA: substrate-binding domain-containing protein [Burkholderiales bacterium]|nr:substrate-binding domain-containing protein [Burkholderiales bacterium]
MNKFQIKPEWILRDPAGAGRGLSQLFELLATIAAEGNLRRACARLNLSYRHAWGIVREGGQTFGMPLIDFTRGQGAKLTPLGDKLVWANKRIAARLTPILDSFASELESEIGRTLAAAGARTRIHASYGYAVAALHGLLHGKRLQVDLRYVGSADALASLCRDHCDLAGFHVPVGDLQPVALRAYAPWLRPRQHRLINLITRRQGLIVAPRNPQGIASLADLTRPGVRFVNRPAGSGTRLLLDMLLEREGLNGSRIAGFNTVEATHAAVAAYIASGMADAGLGVEPAARQFGLGFVPLVNERYFLVCREDAVDSPEIHAVLETARSSEFRSMIAELPGLDGIQCGTLVSVAEAFPNYRFPSHRAQRPRGIPSGERASKSPSRGRVQ